MQVRTGVGGPAAASDHSVPSQIPSRRYAGAVSIRAKSGGRWELRVYAGLDPVTKSKRWVSRTVRGTEREAAKAERALRVEVDTGQFASSDGTVGFLLEQWYATSSPRWGLKYAAGVRAIIDQRWRPALGTKKLSKLEAYDLDRLYGRWEADGLAPATIGQYHAVIRRALRQGVRWGWIMANAAQRATPPPLVRHQLVPPTPAQVKRVIADLLTHEVEFAAFVRFSAASGARRGEVCALRLDDFDEGGVTISRSIGQVGRDTHVKDTKTHQGRRISLDPATLAVVAAQVDRQRDRAARAETVLAPNPYIWSDELDGSKSWKPDRATRAWGRVRARRGLEGVRLHDLRHAVATDMLTGGIDVRTVAGRLGHADPSTTLRVYAQWSTQRDTDAAVMLGARLDDEDQP